MQPPTITATTPREVLISWLAPVSPNGRIQDYRILVIPSRGSPATLSAGLALSATLRVQPFSTYRFSLTVCTNGGCTSSSLVSFSTPEDGKFNTHSISHRDNICIYMKTVERKSVVI